MMNCLSVSVLCCFKCYPSLNIHFKGNDNEKKARVDSDLHNKFLLFYYKISNHNRCCSHSPADRVNYEYGQECMDSCKEDKLNNCWIILVAAKGSANARILSHNDPSNRLILLAMIFLLNTILIYFLRCTFSQLET